MNENTGHDENTGGLSQSGDHAAEQDGTIDQRTGKDTEQIPNSSAIANSSAEHNATINIDATIEHQGTVDFQGTLDHVEVRETRKRVRELPKVPGYEIISELGRGGMGVVYKARQIRLNRMVALKMVLAGGHASPEQLARFDLEARSVARLQHPNIVQIYEIGELEGLPYFSLEFVDGGTLAKQIDRQPQPPRQAAEMIETLARAMQFAHEQNIIHRDLKPANILLTRSAPVKTGTVTLPASSRNLRSTLSKSQEQPETSHAPLTLKISDFGLAKTIEDDGSQNTASGTIMGTPHYMSPEQARGDISTIGPSSDLYSLGAMFYELLTGRPPFHGSTVLDTLDQVRNREPLPVLQLQPKVPIDLETICLKCLQKEPSKRYPSCGDLADDLARFLAGHPIQARPVSSVERFWRWCRRNPLVAGLSAASILFLVGIAVVSTWAAIAMSAKNETITNEKQAALNAAEREKEAAGREKVAADNAIAARKIADDSAKLATTQASIALTTLQKLINKVQLDKGLEQNPETIEFKRFMMQTALDGVTQVSRQVSGSTSQEATQMAAHMQLGNLFRQLGQSKEAITELRKAYEIAKARVVIKQGTDASRRNLTLILAGVADLDREVNRNMKSVLEQYKESLAIWEDILENPKTDEVEDGYMSLASPTMLVGLAANRRIETRVQISEANIRVGATYMRLGDLRSAMPYFEKSLEIRRGLSQANPQNQMSIARTLMAIADTSFRLDDRKTALSSFEESTKIAEEVVKRYPKAMLFKKDLLRALTNKGDFHVRTGEPELARPLYDRALTLAKELVVADPKTVDHQWDVGHAYYRLGLLALRTKDEAAASAHFENCRVIREKLATQDAGNERRKMELMLVLAHCGKHSEATTIATKLLETKPDSELLIDVARCFAQCAAASQRDEGLKQRYTKQAILSVQNAIKQGYRDTVYLSTEVDLDPLRQDPEYVKLLETLRKSPAN